MTYVPPETDALHFITTDNYVPPETDALHFVVGGTAEPVVTSLLAAVSQTYILAEKITTDIEQFYAFPFLLQVGMEQIFGLMYRIRQDVEQTYYLTAPVSAWIEQVYGLRLAGLLTQRYYDAPTIRALLHEWYGAMPELRKTLWQMYGSPLELRAKLAQSITDAPMYRSKLISVYGNQVIVKSYTAQEYGSLLELQVRLEQEISDAAVIINKVDSWYSDSPTIRKILEQSVLYNVPIRKNIIGNYKIYESLRTNYFSEYSIPAGTNIRTSLIPQYNIIDGTHIRNGLFASYSLQNMGTATLQSIETVVTLGDDEFDTIIWDDNIDFTGLNITADIGQFIISCYLSGVTESSYYKCVILRPCKIVHDGVEFVFVVRNRTKSYAHGVAEFNIELGSPTVKLDVPYSRTLSATDTIETEMYAKDIVELMAAKSGIIVDYQILNWLVKSSAISVVGESPLAVIRKIVNAVGGVVQTKPNGELLIISMYPVSPVEWDVLTPSIALTEDDYIADIEVSFDERDGFNAFIISEQNSTMNSINLEVIEVTATTKIIKGYRVPFEAGPFPLLSSGGPTVSINKTTDPVTEQVPALDDSNEWEIVEFINWQGSTTKPIYSIIDIDWIEDELTDDTGIPSSAILDVNESGVLTVLNTDSVPSESLLRIKYTTKYWKWTVTGEVGKYVQFYVPEIEA